MDEGLISTGVQEKIDKKTAHLELDKDSQEALKLASNLGFSAGFDKILNSNRLTANMEHLRTKKNMMFFEELSKTREELKSLSNKVDQMDGHVLDLKAASKISI